jgi:hypothetical protein
LLLAPVLTACLTDSPKIDDNVFPADYKNLKSVKTDLLMSVRDAAISDPALRPLDNAERYVVCVRYNPRMSDSGGYAGLTERMVYFYQGHMTQFLKASPDQCSWATYKPFPGLEKMCAGAGCG